MKTIKNLLSVWMMVMLLVGTSSIQAQNRGRDNDNGNRGLGNDKQNNPGKGHNKGYDNSHGRPGSNQGRYNNNDYDRNDHNMDRKWSKHSSARDGYRHLRYDNHDRYVTYRHYRNTHPSWAPAYGYRYNTRYIFYQDYNVYYDCHRDVFVVWNGRNWVISHHVPDILFRVDFGRTRVTGVDYWDDDFDFYLQRRRPAYVSISAGW